MSAIPGLNTAILDFCTRLDDGPRDEAAARRERPRRDPEEYKWLREALASIEQPEHRLKKLLEVIDNVEVSSKDDHAMNSFEEIQDMVEDLNLATEFGLMKGHKRILNLLRVTRDETVRQYSAMIVAHSSQNHEKLQLLYLDEGVFDVLIPLLVNETHPGARASLVFAISSVCRGCDVTSTAFLKSGGLGALLAVISGHAQDDAKTVARCLALAGYFAESQSTTALPIATVASALATASPASSEVSLIDAAAGAASSILLKASASGPSGEAIAKSMLDQLSNWYDSTSDVPENDLGSERVALRAAYATTRQTLRNGSSNKKPTEVLHTPTCVAGAPPVLGLAAPPSAAA